MTVLLLGDEESELLIAFKAELRAKGIAAIQMARRELVRHLAVNDRINRDGCAAISWTLAGRSCSPSDFSGVLNCLSDLSPDLFRHVAPRDREYAREEIRAYFLFSLSHFSNVINPPRMGGLSGCTQSLPFQWRLVAQFGSSIQVPHYFYGNSFEAPLSLVKSPNLVISETIFSYRYWNSERKQISGDAPLLLYLRPPGMPIIATRLDDDIWSFSLAPDLNNTSLMPEIAKLTCHLNLFFGLRLSQALFFYDSRSNLVTFGSIIPGASPTYLADSERREFFNSLASKLTGSI